VLRALDALSLSPEAQARAESEGTELAAAAIRAEKIEPIIRQALVVGNFAAAVDCCLEAGLMVEALLLAQCGESALWQKAQEAFFAKAKRPFLKILSTGMRDARTHSYLLTRPLELVSLGLVSCSYSDIHIQRHTTAAPDAAPLLSL
jgi:hypothetical protein